MPMLCVSVFGESCAWNANYLMTISEYVTVYQHHLTSIRGGTAIIDIPSMWLSAYIQYMAEHTHTKKKKFVEQNGRTQLCSIVWTFSSFALPRRRQALVHKTCTLGAILYRWLRGVWVTDSSFTLSAFTLSGTSQPSHKLELGHFVHTYPAAVGNFLPQTQT